MTPIDTISRSAVAAWEKAVMSTAPLFPSASRMLDGIDGGLDCAVWLLRRGRILAATRSSTISALHLATAAGRARSSHQEHTRPRARIRCFVCHEVGIGFSAAVIYDGAHVGGGESRWWGGVRGGGGGEGGVGGAGPPEGLEATALVGKRQSPPDGGLEDGASRLIEPIEMTTPQPNLYSAAHSRRPS